MDHAADNLDYLSLCADHSAAFQSFSAGWGEYQCQSVLAIDSNEDCLDVSLLDGPLALSDSVDVFASLDCL